MNYLDIRRKRLMDSPSWQTYCTPMDSLKDYRYVDENVLIQLCVHIE